LNDESEEVYLSFLDGKLNDFEQMNQLKLS